MGRVSVDASQVSGLVRDLRAAGPAAVRKAQPVVARGALETKKRMQADLAESVHFKGTSPSVSYDVRAGAGWVEAVVGPDKKRRGALANIAYFGGSRGGGGTVRDPLEAAEEEVPALEKHLTALVEDW